MPWPLRFIVGDMNSRHTPMIGDCWYMPNWDDPERPYPMLRDYFLKHQASRQYVNEWSDKRPPIMVRLPPGFAFTPDEAYDRPDNVERNGWTVVGSIEDGTLHVSPSVNVVGVYHGWIQYGVVSDDVEGRRFPDGT
jgi:hypothetical protein